MAHRAGRQCAIPSCAGVATTGGRYCPRHTVAETRPTVANVPAVSSRPSPSARGYDRGWQRIRRRILASNPLCVHCRENGRVTLATEVDHIIPLRAGGTHDDSNLQPLCKSCHSRKTGAEKREKSADNGDSNRGGAV